ncbi:sec-independent translocase [Streptomyces sp. NBC_01224]|uniref:sec-independent translocase n=1 Tax=Streptomyces sp. NBC_01224 TaxID=2903783 RepID=UPI002E10CCFC|nr:sec-independent translocase [Streptomyces sp. NBC_01224]
MFSDVGPLELITLAFLAVLLFGPDKLPELIQNVTGLIRKFRQFTESAKQEIRSELGPEFGDFEFEDLHPKTLVRKHVLNGDGLGFDEIRSALDPGQELAEVADAIRDTADGEAPESSATGPVLQAKAPGPVSFKKDGETTAPAHTPFDADVT